MNVNRTRLYIENLNLSTAGRISSGMGDRNWAAQENETMKKEPSGWWERVFG